MERYGVRAPQAASHLAPRHGCWLRAGGQQLQWSVLAVSLGRFHFLLRWKATGCNLTERDTLRVLSAACTIPLQLEFYYASSVCGENH